MEAIQTQAQMNGIKFGFNVGLLLKEADRKGISSKVIEEAMLKASGKHEAMGLLRIGRFSYQVIGDAVGITRQRAHQIIGTVEGVKCPLKKEPDKIVLSLTAEKIYKLAATDPDVWTESGRLKREFVIKHLLEAGFGKTRAGKIAGTLKKPKAAIIMFGVLNIPFNDHKQWLLDQQAAGSYQVRVWEKINNKTPVVLSQMAFCRYCHSIGVSERKRIL